MESPPRVFIISLEVRSLTKDYRSFRKFNQVFMGVNPNYFRKHLTALSMFALNPPNKSLPQEVRESTLEEATQ